jgi:hypothetical protein
MAKTKELPLTFVSPSFQWKLMEKNKIPGFHTEVATITVGKGRVWTFSMEMLGRGIILFTDLPRPDGGLGSAIYTMSLVKGAEELANALAATGVKPKKRRTTQ